MSRSVVISGLGPISALGIGPEANWQGVCAGRSGLGPVQSFDAREFPCSIAGEVPSFKVADYVPKSYRKATKVMASDIELAVVAADQAARDAKLRTKGTDPEAAKSADFKATYAPGRVGCHVGAGLIAADLDELTYAFAAARTEAGFDLHKWGQEGMQQLTPLWLLKYLPNMLACHVTIIHETNGPSNTITCAEASSGLSIGESLRVIQRQAADLCFCGGTEDKLNPMGLIREILAGRLNTQANATPDQAVRPFSQTAAGSVVGEGGALLMLEAEDTFRARAERDGATAYAKVVGFGASQSVHRESRNRQPDPEGRGIAAAIAAALREGQVQPDEVDLIIPCGLGWDVSDAAEAAALRRVFGAQLERIPLWCSKPLVGNTAAGAGAFDACMAALALHHQMIPPVLNVADPLPGLQAGSAPLRSATVRNVLTYSISQGGQNAALLLQRVDG